MANNLVATTFAGVALPTAAPEHELGTDDSLSAYVVLPNRALYDPLGTEQAQGRGRQIAIRAAVTGSAETTIATAVDALRALRGKQGDLVITMADASTRTRKARCERIDESRVPHERWHRPLTFHFQLLGSGWKGTYHDGSGAYVVTLDSSPKSMEIANGGNDVVRDVTMAIMAGSADITAITIANAEAGHVSAITYTGTIAAGKVLVIDAPTWTVLNDGADAWSGISFESTHAIRELLRLMPGNNTINVTLTGGSTDSTIAFVFYDLWS